MAEGVTSGDLALMGRWVGWATSGTQASTATGT